MPTLYELVKESKENNHALQMLINIFEPKIKKSLHLTKCQEREDLAQELKCKLITCIRNYDIDSTPDFWDLRHSVYQNKSLDMKNVTVLSNR